MKNENLKFYPIIGLEIHCELKTQTKMFCACLNEPDCLTPNKNICPLCSGQPGSLPVPNKKAIIYTIKTGLALNCEIATISKFDRKNYYYPDLPKGYQISQYDKPLCQNGYLNIGSNPTRKIRIKRIHIEEDTGKLLHSLKENISLIDYNRSGVPLMELVTEPDFSSGEEASEFAKTLQVLFKKYLKISDADMEKGHLRVEANISLSNNPKEIPDYKVEIKNLNSFKALRDAIDFEINRQASLLKNNEAILQETRGWDQEKRETFPQRFKEEAQDYRYFPEPDIPPIKITHNQSAIKDDENQIYLDEIIQSLPELPWERKNRFQKEYNLSEKDAEFFVFEKEMGDYFEEVVSELKSLNKNKESIKLAANYIISRLQKLISESFVSIEHLKITPENFAKLIHLISQNKISSTGAQILLEEMFKTGANPNYIIESRGLKQISDENFLEQIVKEVINENPKAVADFKGGKKEILMFLVGQVMKKTSGKANPQIAKTLFEKQLK